MPHAPDRLTPTEVKRSGKAGLPRGHRGPTGNNQEQRFKMKEPRLMEEQTICHICGMAQIKRMEEKITAEKERVKELVKIIDGFSRFF